MSTLLVLEDRVSDRQLMATFLGYAGHTVLEASTGEAALELARAESPDLIFADILMPGMNGYEFVGELRQDARIGDTPVVFCTATYGEPEVRQIAEVCGVSHVLTKPIDPEEVARVAREVLGSKAHVRPRVPTDEFVHEHLRVLNEKLVQKVRELEVAHDRLHRAQRETAESLTMLEAVHSSAPVGFGFIDREFRIRSLNDTLAAVNGAPAEKQIGRTVAEVVPEVWPSLEPHYRHVLESGEAVLNHEVEGSGTAPGEVRHWLVNYYPVRVEGEVIGIGVVVVDISERKQAEDFRSVVMETMAEGLYVLDAEGRLVFLNAAGARMLGWKECELRGRNMHEAIHFQHGDGSTHPEDECELLKVLTRGETVRVDDDAFSRRDGTVMSVAYSAAPLTSGTAVRGVVVVFRDTTEEMSERDRVRRELDALSWVGRIRDAIDDGRLVLYSQPIVPLNGGEPREELLLRMLGRDGEIIAPGSFLPVAERYGLIGEIDQWVIGQAIDLAATGRRVQANLSAESIGKLDLLSLIEVQLADTGADPANLVVEITETAMMRDAEAGETFARGLTALGCSLALDDFGTGFGSFTYLMSLSVKYLKIDIEFVRYLASDAPNQHLVKAIVNLARGFGHETIAEGVEDAETLELLREYGVDFAQGYHLGRPAPI